MKIESSTIDKYGNKCAIFTNGTSKGLRWNVMLLKQGDDKAITFDRLYTMKDAFDLAKHYLALWKKENE